MVRLKIVMASLMLVLLAACGESFTAGPTEPPLDVTQLAPMRVSSFTVTVPPTLTVSEENTYDPKAEIVWRADPFGPRHPQVKAVMEAGVAAGIRPLTGDTPVVLDIVVRWFHSQTEKVRYSFGGKYELAYDLTVRDARSGDVIIPTYRVFAIVDAPGGIEALAADQAGRTEKIDNINLVAGSIYTQLTGRQLTGPLVQPR